KGGFRGIWVFTLTPAAAFGSSTLLTLRQKAAGQRCTGTSPDREISAFFPWTLNSDKYINDY
ncbi:MAG: hypothetical protein KJ822_14470, partial [Proteobacteria bacterium]|nr:hypothetical protein [Pseudomonadota bacterium]